MSSLQELMLLAMFLFSFCSPSTAFSPVSKNLVSENLHENTQDNTLKESNYVRAVRGGGGGGQAGGDNSQSNSSPKASGTAIVPVYTAGAAASQHKNHIGAAATRTPYRVAVLIATSASLLLYTPMYNP